MCIPGKMCVPGEGVHSQWGCAFPVRMCILGESHPHSRWGCAFPVRHVPIPSEVVYYWWVTSPIPSEAHPHYWRRCVLLCDSSLPQMRILNWEWVCGSPILHILTKNGNVPHWECTSLPGMEMWLTANAHPHWECTSSPRMHILTGICISSLEMQ